MNFKVGTLFVLSMIIFVIINFGFHSNEKLHKNLIEQYDAPLNQKERYEWEFNRLKDPKTGKIPSNIFQKSIEFAQTLPKNYKWDKHNKIQQDDWQLRGPINIGGRTRALALDVRNEKIMLAGGVSGGLWKTTDFGKTWKRTTKPYQLQSTSCIAQDKRPGKEDTWYLGTGEYFNIYGGLRGDGIYKSTDNGESWFLLESTVSNTPNSWDNGFDYVWNVVTDHTDLINDVVYAATAVGAIQKSTDGGQTWKIVLGGFGNTYSWFTDIAITPSGVLYATLSQKTFAEQASSEVMGIYRSTDGDNWTEITPEFIPQKYRRIVIAVSPSDENQIYFLAETPGYGKMTTNTRGDSLWHSLWKYTYVSGDGSGEGGIWEDRTIGIPAPERIRSQFNSQGSYDLVVAVKPDDPEVVFIGGTNLYRSTDGFKTEENVTLIGGYCWDDTSCYEIYTYPNHHADQHAIIFLPSNPKVLISGSDGGVAVTYDNLASHVEWESLNWAYYTTQFYTCAIDHAIPGNPNIIGGMQDNGTKYTYSFDINVPWTNPAGADGFHCAIADSSKFIITSNNTSRQPFIKLWRTILDDKGEIVIKTRIDPIGAKDMIWNTPFKLDPNNSLRLYLAGGNILWRNNNLNLIPFEDSKDSTSFGWDSLTHTALNNNNPSMGRAERISAVEVSVNPANIVYYGTTYGRIFRIDDAHQGDPVPEEITGENLPKNSNIGCIAVDPKNADKVFVVFTNFNVVSIFYSTDGGQNWEPVSGNLEQFPNGAGIGPAIYYLEILPIGNRNIYLVGTSTGIYSTAYLDGENTVWQQEGPTTVGNVMVYQLDSRHSDGYVAAASFGLGMFATKINSLPPQPSSPILTHPINDTTGVLDKITLAWSATEDAGNFILQIASDEEFKNIINEIDGLKDTKYNLVNLEQGLKKYYWRVFSRGAGGLSKPSEIWSFETAVKAPKLLSPTNNAKDIKLPAIFTWNTNPNADEYHFQLSNNLIFSNVIIDTIVTINNLIIENLEANKRYYWRVSSIRIKQEGLFSDDFRFTTAKSTNIDDILSHNILSIYPNPVKDKLTINFELKRPSLVSICLYDINSKIVQNNLSKYLNYGRQIIELNLTGLNEGTYFICININSHQIFKKFILNK